jgi:hypothetical protein
MPDVITSEEIIDELIAAFKSTCRRPHDEALDVLRRFIEVTAIQAVDEGAEYEAHREYLLNNFREIGAALNAVRTDEPVSPGEMIDRCEEQVTKGQEKLARARDRARERGDNERLDALAGEGAVCLKFTRADLE